MNLQTLKVKRAAKVGEMTALNDKVKSEKRDFNEEEKKQWDTLDGERRSLADQIDRQTTLDAFEREIEAGENVSDPETRELSKGFSVAKAVTEALTGKLTGREAEYAQERQRSGETRAANGILVPVPTQAILGDESRAITTTTPGTGPGSNLVATDLATMTDRTVTNAIFDTILTQPEKSEPVSDWKERIKQ